MQALKDSKEVEIIDMKIRCQVEPDKWPLPGLGAPDQPQTDFSQLINCPEFVPRQPVGQQPLQSRKHLSNWVYYGFFLVWVFSQFE